MHQISAELGHGDTGEDPAPAARRNEHEECQREAGGGPEAGAQVHRVVQPEDELREGEIPGGGAEEQEQTGHPAAPGSVRAVTSRSDRSRPIDRGQLRCPERSPLQTVHTAQCGRINHWPRLVRSAH